MTTAQAQRIRETHLRLLVQTGRVLDEAEKLREYRDELIRLSAEPEPAQRKLTREQREADHV